MTIEHSATAIASQLCDFLRDNIVAEGITVTPETDLSAIGIDSFSLMELVLFIERRFGLALPAESLVPENIANAKQLSAYCAKRLAQQVNA